MNAKHNSIALFVVVVTLVIGIASSVEAKLIENVVDFVMNRNNLEWIDFNENEIVLDGPEENLNVVRLQDDEIPSGNPKMGTFYGNPLYVRARADLQPGIYGVLGRYTTTLPENRYIQFQGMAEILAGKENGVVVALQVEARSRQTQEWVVERTFYGEQVNLDDSERKFLSFLSNLSPWANQEVRISLVLRVTPKYLNLNGIERLEPQEISAQWITAEIVSSPFHVVIGPSERVDMSSILSGKLSDRPFLRQVIPSTTISTSTETEERIIEGGLTGTYGHIQQPDAPIASFLTPAGGGYPSRFVCYFSTRLNDNMEPHGGSHDASSPEWEYGASSRVVDFVYKQGDNLYSATVSQITNAIEISNGTAVAVLSPSGDSSLDFDDHYAGITTAASSYLSDDTAVIHAFYHAEDHFQFEDDGSGDEHNDAGENYGTPYMASIGYARSVAGTNNFGRAFSKVSNTSGDAVITYNLNEEQVYYDPAGSPSGQPSWGCGSPSLYAVGNYYYLLYTTWNWNKNITSASRTVAAVSLARALKSDVNSTSYSTSANPWKKFEEANSTWDHAGNYTQAGRGGTFSALINAVTDAVTGFRTDQALDPNNWRAYPKLSYNEYLDANFPGHQMVLMLQGSDGFYLYTAEDLVNWDDGLKVMNNHNCNYPTLIGSQGYDAHTTEVNKLFYSQLADGATHLYRCSLTIVLD